MAPLERVGGAEAWEVHRPGLRTHLQPLEPLQQQALMVVQQDLQSRATATCDCCQGRAQAVAVQEARGVRSQRRYAAQQGHDPQAPLVSPPPAPPAPSHSPGCWIPLASPPTGAPARPPSSSHAAAPRRGGRDSRYQLRAQQVARVEALAAAVARWASSSMLLGAAAARQAGLAARAACAWMRVMT